MLLGWNSGGLLIHKEKNSMLSPQVISLTVNITRLRLNLTSIDNMWLDMMELANMIELSN
jgi:hypothetical protein